MRFKPLEQEHNMKKIVQHRLIKLSLVTMLACSSLFAELPSSSSVDTSALKESSVSSNVDAQLEKIYDGVREFHIFKSMYKRWSSTDTFTTLVTGQNGFPVFSARSDKDPKFTDYPIDYSNKIIKRYHPVRPPESAKAFYSEHNIQLGDKETATYNAPIVSAGTIGKGRVIAMGSHLYGSILVNSRNYSSNYSNRDNDTAHTPDSADMENFFHNVMAWLTEQNPNENKRYKKNGSSISILSNKARTMFWHTGGATYERDSEAFVMDERYNVSSGENPKIVPTWKEAFENGDLDPSKYPMIIVEDFKRVSAWTRYWKNTERKTQLDEVDLLIDYVRKGGGLLIMDSPSFADEEGITQTAGSEILKKAGITTFFTNNKSNVKILPNKTEVGGVDQFDMCLLDYIGHTDLQRRLGLDDYKNVPKTLDGLKSLLDSNGNINYLEEVLSRRKREIFSTGSSTIGLTEADCGKVELELEDGSKANVQTTLVKGDGIVQNEGKYDKYAKYPVDLNFVQAQGDVGGSMNTLLAHELKDKTLSTNDLNREYTNMSALLLNDATFTGEKFQSLNELLRKYKTGGEFVNGNGEFYPGFSFSKKDVLDFRRKPVTRIMVERAFYDNSLKYDPSEYPGEKSSTGSVSSATIYLQRNRVHQKWYAGNMQSTGLYAPAHQEITVTLPDGVDPTKMRLQIGVGDNVGGIFRHEINLKRPPKYVKNYKFNAQNGAVSPTITVEHPYGGLIYLKSYDSSAETNATAKVSFANVQTAIHFVLGSTTQDEWGAMKSAIAPKAELESEHYIVTVPRSSMANLSFSEVTQIAKNYDRMAENAYDFYGYNKTCVEPFTPNTPASCNDGKKQAHKNREVFDPHISIGSGHSGYPIMVMNWNPTNTNFPQDPTNNWLVWHEMGHNMAESWLNIAGAGEVANNVMALHQQKRFGMNLKTSQSISNVGMILGKGQPWADGGNSGRLLMFHQLPKWIDANYLSEFKEKNPKYYENGEAKAIYPFLDGDGFDIYKILHREARDTTTEGDKYDSCMKQSGATKTDMLALCTSAILELDTKPFLQAWKAGVVGIGNVDGQNVYDSTGGLSSGFNSNYTATPAPAIEAFRGL
jgi:accessory colonization factor AcfD